MSLAKLTSKGQITIPKTVRDHLGLHAGDQIEFFTDANNRVYVKPKTTPVKEILGMAGSGKKITIEEMNKAIALRGEKYKK